jgi:nucleotide-binding universal stress UspA family protein
LKALDVTTEAGVRSPGDSADVIVLTRRPRPAISRVLLGSVAGQVMRKATCPVLTVAPERK